MAPILASIIPKWVFPSPTLVVASLLTATLLDVLYPRHEGLLYKVHPVHTCYFMALRLGKLRNSRSWGVLVWFTCVLTHLTVYGAVLYIYWCISPIAWVIVASYVIKVSITPTLLIKTVYEVFKCGKAGNYRCVRDLTQSIVRRDVYSIGIEYVYSACIESLFESLVDGVTSPLLYLVIFGPLGALTQRLANTMDGALGFKTKDLVYVGWFSALMDTIINYIPARLTSLAIVLLSPLIGRAGVAEALSTYLRHYSRTESINAGHPMSAAAAALRIRLEKLGHYVLGEGSLPKVEDVGLSIRLAIYALIASYVTALAATYLIH